jgi:hypothetical protein
VVLARASREVRYHKYIIHLWLYLLNLMSSRQVLELNTREFPECAKFILWPRLINRIVYLERVVLARASREIRCRRAPARGSAFGPKDCCDTNVYKP